MKKNNLIFLLFCIVSLSACTGDQCIDSDDFGFQTFTISSRYTSDQLYSQVQGHEVAPWVKSGYTVNGRTLTILVRTWVNGEDQNNAATVSAWCPWYGTQDNTATLSTFCARLQQCIFADGAMCTGDDDAPITNAPCLLSNGIGLYTLIAQGNGYDPNISFTSERNPSGITFHLGEPTVGYNLYDVSSTGDTRRAGGVVYQYSGSNSMKYAGSPLYFKILDKFYDDNNGQYRVAIKSGVSDNRPDPIQFLTLLVRQNLFGIDGSNSSLNSGSYSNIVSQVNQSNPTINVYRGANTNSRNGIIPNIYANIIADPGYNLAVYGMLCLYVMFTGLSYLTGNINITNTELVTRLFKFSLVSVLLSSQYAWSFFHDYLFVYFVEGVTQILNMVQDAGASGPGSSSLLGLMIAPQTQAKLWSLLFSDWSGFIYIILFLIVLYFVIMMTFEAAILYLTSLIAVGMIIIMAPIFICFLLFKITRSLFDNWLKQLISYAVQPIILFTGLALISMIIRAELYSSLGFRVCKHDFPNLGSIGDIFGLGMINAISGAVAASGLDPSLTQSIFYWWFPHPMTSNDFTRTQAIIPVPYDHFQADGTTFCAAYSCFENRYIELPFLDPVQDITRINNFFAGNFVQFDGLLLIFVSVYLLSKFNDTSTSVAKFLSNTSGNYADVQKTQQDTMSSLKSTIAEYTPPQVTEKYEQVKGAIREQLNRPGDWLAEKYENFQMNRLEQKALDPSSANPAVLEEVKRNYGIDPEKVNVKAEEHYHEALQDKLKELNPNIDHKAKATELANKDFSELKNEFTALKFGEGKKYDKLEQKDKDEIDKVFKSSQDGKSLRELSADTTLTKDYQKAYTNAHQYMSERGIGFFGKRVSALRSLEELDHKIDTNKALKDDKRRQIGESLYSGYEGVKRTLLAGVVGEKNLGNVGAAWHEMDERDPRLRTYDEVLRDQERHLESRELKKQLDQEVVKAGEDVLRPEYLAKLEANGNSEKLNKYKSIAEKQLKHAVRSALAGENGAVGFREEPALMGEKFMREKATDSQLKEMIDRSYQVQQKLISTDRYTGKENYYETKNEKALEHIQEKYDLLKKHVDMTNVKPEKLPEILGQYHLLKSQVELKNVKPEELAKLSQEYLNKNKDIDQFKMQQMGKEVTELQTSINSFNYTAAVLSQIDERKTQIAQEINKHVVGVNKHRTDAKMSEYKPEWLTKQLKPIERKTITIEAQLRTKNPQ